MDTYLESVDKRLNLLSPVNKTLATVLVILAYLKSKKSSEENELDEDGFLVELWANLVCYAMRTRNRIVAATLLALSQEI